MAETEKKRFSSSRGIRLPMMVLLPLPEGAQKIMTLLILHHVENLFLDLLQLILHADHYVLHLCLVALAA